MAVRMYARGSDGVVAITDAAANEATFQDYINKPLKNINKVYFHSNFDYMKLASKFTASITLPQRNRETRTESSKGKSSTYDIPAAGTQRHLLGSHALGYIPFATSVRGANQVTPTAPIQTVGASQRIINVEMDENSVYIYESWSTYQYNLSAITESFTVWVFRNPA
jgi:hypothetical protein